MSKPNVVIIGGGFGGLQCARSLSGTPTEVLLLDKNNYHLFTPLLYQVASSLLNPSDIAYPIRTVFRRTRNVRFMMAEVAGVNFKTKTVRLIDGTEKSYDYLVIAAGSETNFFGLESVGRMACGLKDLPEALALRNHILRCFEAAAQETSEELRQTYLTFIVVGGGPTGVEYAGALSELVRLVLAYDYPEIGLEKIRIILIEAMPELFPTFPSQLGHEARKRLERLGVTAQCNTKVQEVTDNLIKFSNGESIVARTLVWAAGVKPAGLASTLDAACSRSGRIEVDEFLRVRGQTHVFAIGDIASFTEGGREIPMIASPAIQEARQAAANIMRSIANQPLEPFHYRDPGMMATIGRNSAVVHIKNLSLKGFIGWIAWLFVHLYFLIGFRNRIAVLSGWAWNYLRYDRPIRLIARAGERD
ncbi:MAG: NAD(P)/FAD-dependent oxidoreductase [Elusimicrobia bacterium]|nr:NAD(P)/FAD-dependent oxidoreductase [Elusimicrobiota bacterium]